MRSRVDRLLILKFMRLAHQTWGISSLYSIINSKDGQLCDRAYLPAPDLSAKLRETKTDLFAVESKRSLRA